MGGKDFEMYLLWSNAIFFKETSPGNFLSCVAAYQLPAGGEHFSKDRPPLLKKQSISKSCHLVLTSLNLEQTTQPS